MQKNEGKTLLLNFTEAELRSIQRKLPGRHFDRGYITDNASTTQNYLYSPVAVYEYSAIFAKIGPFEEADSFTQYQDSFILIKGDVRSSLLKHWKRDNTLLVVFVGDSSFSNLTDIGIPADLKPSRRNDTEIIPTKARLDDPPATIRNLASLVSEPPERYLNFPDETNSGYNYYNIGVDYKILMKNKNGDNVGAAFMKGRYDHSTEKIGALILPLSAAASGTVELFKTFGPIYGFGQTASAWEDDLSILPSGQINILNEELRKENERHEAAVKQIDEAIEAEKTRYRSLKELLTSQGETLVDAVVYALQDILELTVTKSDETQKSSLKEDIVLSIEGSDYLYEIKGTKSANPALGYPMQPLAHIARQPDRQFAGAGLILNHDFETKPEERTNAYDTKETRALIKEIAFIDTRVLHAIAIGVIDGTISREAVIPKLTSTGRLTIDESILIKLDAELPDTTKPVAETSELDKS